MSSRVQFLSKFSFICVALCAPTLAQEPTAKPPDPAKPVNKAAALKPEEKPALPFQIQLLETHIRFETNGDSRKEVHTIVKINDLAGARQFSRLGFDYNRAFQQVEIPLVKISHANGGTSEILPSAITDAPNPAVQDFPAYHDVRVKSVRILGLQDGDTLEYRVVTTTTKPPLAPDFWLEHTFDRSGQVNKEIYELDLPAQLFESRPFTEESNQALGWRRLPPELAALSSPLPAGSRLYISKSNPAKSIEHRSEEGGGRLLYLWELGSASQKEVEPNPDRSAGWPDVVVSTDWGYGLSEKIKRNLWRCSWHCSNAIEAIARKLASGSRSGQVGLPGLYGFVSNKIVTVDLPLGTTGFRGRTPDEILSSGYGSQEDKAILLLAFIRAISPGDGYFVLAGPNNLESPLPRPSLFTTILVVEGQKGRERFLDPGGDVMPIGVIPPSLRGKKGLVLNWPGYGTSSNSEPVEWKEIPKELPFKSFQRVNVEGAIALTGELKVKVRYAMRGDNELVLREALHQTPKERWKEVAGLLALSDGFRGTITNVSASDPMATKDPFSVEYEITLPKFVDWSKKPVRIPALLPQIAIPDAPGKDAGKIELGTPLDVQTTLTLKLPEGTTVQSPAATSVARDYATFASKYDGHLNTVTASRHINFLKREIPTERAPDYNAFLRAVQNDQAQMLVLLPPSAATVTTP